MTLSSWLIGSARLMAEASITINGNVEVVLPVGAYYLRDPDPARSLVDVLEAALDGPLDAPAVTIGRDRRLRIAAAAPFTAAFDVVLQPLLGFAANVDAPTTLAVANTPSALLWSPGWVETPELTPRGVAGAREVVEALTSSASGRTVHTTVMNVAKVQRYRWEHVAMARAWTPGVEDGEPGQFVRFLYEVIHPNRRWKLYSPMSEDDASGLPVSWDPAPLGPYKRRKAFKSTWFDRQFPADTIVRSIRLECGVVNEYS